MQVIQSNMGTSSTGRKVAGVTISNRRGMSFTAISYGATITKVNVPDKSGSAANVVLGYETLQEYERGTAFLGCIVGRFANRVGGARFVLGGKEYPLAKNDGANSLHGGTRGFDKMVWTGKVFRRRNTAGVRYTYTSRNGEEGYPGRLKVTVDYALTEDSQLSFEYWAVTDASTPVNLTNHTYWNLAGSGTVLAQELMSSCPFYLPTDQGLIPTGEIARTAGTPVDFSTPKPIGRDIASVGLGFDHCLVLHKPYDALGHACTARDPSSGRALELWTTQPGVQLYSGNHLDGRPFPRHGAFCLETQHFPDSVNQGQFPSCILGPDQVYHQLTVHKFSA
jgi:aldose 1-epimerase